MLYFLTKQMIECFVRALFCFKTKNGDKDATSLHIDCTATDDVALIEPDVVSMINHAEVENGM